MTRSHNRQVTVACVQQSGLSESPPANLEQLLLDFEQAAEGGVDFLVATELALTPYFGAVRDRSLTEWAEGTEGEAVTRIAEFAARHSTTVVLPLYLSNTQPVGDDAPEALGEDAALVIGPDGKIVAGAVPGAGTAPWFTKVHLPRNELADRGIDETLHFRPGSALPVFETDKATIGVLICYDRRFPEAWRTLALAGAEIIFVPACVPAWKPAQAASTGDLFVSELQTRACENLVFVAACNRAGDETLGDRVTRFVGRSCLIGPGGGVLDEAPAEKSCILKQTFDLEEIATIRGRLPLFKHRRPEAYVLGLDAQTLSRSSGAGGADE